MDNGAKIPFTIQLLKGKKHLTNCYITSLKFFHLVQTHSC